MPAINETTPRPSIEGLSALEDLAPSTLHLSGLNIGILSISVDTHIHLVAENVKIATYCSIEAGPGSNVTFSGSTISTPTWIDLQNLSSCNIFNCALTSVTITPIGMVTVTLLGNNISETSTLTLHPASRLAMISNTFERGMRIMAHNSTMLISKNEFKAPEKPLNFGQSWLPNLLLEIRCSAWIWIDENIFYNGTFQISDNSEVVGTNADDKPGFDMDASLSSSSSSSAHASTARDLRENRPPRGWRMPPGYRPGPAHPPMHPHDPLNITSPHYPKCSLDLQFGSCLKFNRFISEERHFRVYDLLDKPAEPRLVFLKGLDVGPLRMAENMGYVLDATQNWWGDASGPFLCCNPGGQGSYTSLSVNVSDWCSSPACASFSNVKLSSHCLKSGCSQVLDRAALITFSTSALLALLLLTGSICFSVYHNIRYFSVSSFERYSREHLLPKAHVQWRVGLGFSSIGAMLAITNASVLIASTMQTSAHAHQHIIPFRGFVILWIYVCLAVFQLCLTSLGFIMSFAGSNRIAWLIKPLYGWNLLNVIVTIVITIDWLPTAGFVDLLAHFFITESSHLLNLLYLSSVLLCLVSIAAFIPVRLMNQLMNHSELARISAALEVALLKELMHSPTVEVKAKYLRISSAISIILGMFPMMTVIYDLTIDSYFRTRLWLSVVQHGLGLICLIAIFITSFYYNQRLLTTLLTLILATVTVGCIQDIIFWSFYQSVAVDSIYTYGYVTFQIALSTIWTVSLVAHHCFVYLLNHSVSTELPKMAIENLNTLIDRNVLDPVSFTSERIPLLYTESDSSRNASIQHESETLTSHYDYYSTDSS